MAELKTGTGARAQISKLAELFRKAQSENDQQGLKLAGEAAASLGVAEAQEAVFLHNKTVLEAYLKR